MKAKFKEKIKLLETDPLNPSLKTHKLSGKLDGYWAFRIDYFHRIVFKFVQSNEVLLITIGSHDEVY